MLQWVGHDVKRWTRNGDDPSRILYGRPKVAILQAISFCTVVSLRGQLVQLALVTYGREETMSGGPRPGLSPLSLNGEVLMSARSSSAEQRPGISSFKCARESLHARVTFEERHCIVGKSHPSAQAADQAGLTYRAPRTNINKACVRARVRVRASASGGDTTADDGLGRGLPIVVNDDGTEDAHRTNGVSPSNRLCHWLHRAWCDARQVKRSTRARHKSLVAGNVSRVPML